MTRTKLRVRAAEQAARFINDAVALVLDRACYVCRAAQEKLQGHADCWRLVQLAREIRKLGERGGTK